MFQAYDVSSFLLPECIVKTKLYGFVIAIDCKHLLIAFLTCRTTSLKGKAFSFFHCFKSFTQTIAFILFSQQDIEC